ncbi:MAG TPA: hypothetical protein ENN46_04465, partial [Candidatus Woesearchaeota archaeon]|nr:hypothetical protein [Candidatus Woesearchaeota archaeon]
MREINNDMNIRSAEELESMIETESGEISFYLRKKNAGCDSSGEEKACVYESIKNELSGYSQQIRINKLNNLE